MAATKVEALIGQVRKRLVDTRAKKFWSDDELLEYMTDGAKDLWGAYLDIYADHYLRIDTEHVTLEANATSLKGVPDNCFRVHMIEPRDTTSSGDLPAIIFVPKKYNAPDFVLARSLTALDPTTAGAIFYDVSGVGAPSGAPEVLTAPKVNSQITLRFVYNPTLEPLTMNAFNPIPGESDNALKAYTVAYARAKERPDRTPDPGWIAVYATEKQSLLSHSTPRQDQEPDTVEGLFDNLWYN